MEAATFMIVASAASAVATLASAEQQAIGMRLQAQQAELQGRQNALNYNRQANQILERQQMLASTARARAASGGIDPLTGSPMSLEQANAYKAGTEIQMAKENAELSIYGGLAQSQSLQSAADATQTIGLLSAASQAGMGYAKSQSVQTPSSSQGTSSWWS